MPEESMKNPSKQTLQREFELQDLQFEGQKPHWFVPTSYVPNPQV
jgi:hypothetical protein